MFCGGMELAHGQGCWHSLILRPFGYVLLAEKSTKERFCRQVTLMHTSLFKGGKGPSKHLQHCNTMMKGRDNMFEVR